MPPQPNGEEIMPDGHLSRKARGRLGGGDEVFAEVMSGGYE